ncbi:MAG: hypothetical protein ACI8P0_001325 [Planctomycetaceae bacterium]
MTAINAGPLAEFPGCQVIDAGGDEMRIVDATRMAVANAPTGLRYDTSVAFSVFSFWLACDENSSHKFEEEKQHR